MESILLTICKMLGIDEDNREFDIDVITNINAVFSKLSQIGVSGSFSITGLSETWNDYGISGDALSLVKNYMYHEVRLMFDPPTASYVLSSLEKIRDEEVWRLNVMCDKEGT